MPCFLLRRWGAVGIYTEHTEGRGWGLAEFGQSNRVEGEVIAVEVHSYSPKNYMLYLRRLGAVYWLAVHLTSIKSISYRNVLPGEGGVFPADPITDFNSID